MTDSSYNSGKLAVLPIAPRDNLGRFQKGGAPGRPFGAKGKRSREALEQIKSFGPAAIQKLWDAVNAGERWAVEFVLARILPTNSRTIEFEGLEIDDIREAFKQGDISTSELKDIVSSLEKIANVEEMDQLRERLEKLEAIANGNR